MKTYKIKNKQKLEINQSEETLDEIKNRKLGKLKKQLKVQKFKEINSHNLIDEMIEHVDTGMSYGEIGELRYYVNNLEGMYVHKQIVKGDEIVFDSVRYCTPHEEELYLQHMLSDDPLF